MVTSNDMLSQGIIAAYWLDKALQVPMPDKQLLWLTGQTEDPGPVKLTACDQQVLDKIAQGNEWSEFAVITALYAVVLHKCIGLEKGLLSCAPLKEGQPALYFKYEINEGLRMKDFIRSVSAEIERSVQHAVYDFDLLCQQLNAHGTDLAELACFGLTDTGLTQIHHPSSVLSLCLNILRKEKRADALTVTGRDSRQCSYAAHIGIYLKKLLARLDTLLDIPLNDVLLLDAVEAERVMNYSTGISLPLPEEQSVTALFETKAQETPAVVALVHGSRQWTYEALNREANKTAYYLRDFMEVTEGVAVGILLERSDWMIISWLAVLKAGGVCVPLDVAHPGTRLAYMLGDAGITSVITMSDHLVKLEGYEGQAFVADLQAEFLEEQEKAPGAVITGDSPAYIIYTSGSAGQPKGVCMHHRAVVNLVQGLVQEVYQYYEAPQRVAMVAPLTFDPSVQQTCGALLNGHTLYIVPEETRRTGTLLWKYLVDHGIHICDGTPSHLQLLSAINQVPGPLMLRHLLIGGEALTGPVVKQFAEKIRPATCRITNLYGLTECGVDNTFCHVDPLAAGKEACMPIGRPLSNQQVYVLNTALRLQPVGIPGDIYIGGENVGKGYLNADELTRERFLPDPAHPGKYLFRTADVGMWNEDGMLVYIGRADTQVKIRGYRIEPGEITAVLSGMPGVRQCITVARKGADGVAYLASYVACNGTVNTSELKILLENTLPAYMVPAHIVMVDHLPLTHNGKTDVKTLPDPLAVETTQQESIAPATIMEIVLAELWRKLLEKKDIHAGDNFFALGGHSLKATQLVMWVQQSIGVDLTVIDIFNHPVLQDLAAHIDQLKSGSQRIIPKSARDGEYPLSYGQRQLWVLHQMEPDLIAYNMINRYRITGTLAPDKLKAAIDKLIERHEVLRTTFSETDGEPVQIIHRPSALNNGWLYRDLRHEPDPESVAIQQADQEARSPFDLEKGPLFKIAVWRVAEDGYVLQLSLHHIITDGWSISILVGELLSWYNGRMSGLEPRFRELSIQYADFVLWQQQQLAAGSQDKQYDYWFQRLREEIPRIQLPFGKPRPTIREFAGNAIHSQLSANVQAALPVIAVRQDASLFMVLVAAFKLLLYKYTGQTDVVIGTPVDGRIHHDLENQVGYYTQVLPLRTKVRSSASFKMLLSAVRQTLLEAYDNQSYPTDLLADKLQLRREPGRHPFFDFLVVMQPGDQQLGVGGQATGFTITSVPVQTVSSQFDIVLRIYEEAGNISLTFEYDIDLFDHGHIQHMVDHYSALLENIVKDPDQPLSAISCLTALDQQALCVDFNDTNAFFPENETLTGLFEQQVKAGAARVALIEEDASYTFGQLNTQADRLAAYLQQHCNVKPGDIVGVAASRTVHMVSTMLGIMKAGAAYLPVDPAYPPARINHMLSNAAASVMVSDVALPHGIGPAVKVCHPPGDVNDDPVPYSPVISDSRQPAYVIYTSGSTGQPKGVMVAHRAVGNRLYWMWNALRFNQEDIILQKTSATFDVSVWEIFLPLCFGARMVLSKREEAYDPEALVRLIDRNKITALHFVPNMYAVFLKMTGSGNPMLASLRMVCCSGDILTAQHVTNHYNSFGIPLYNLFGPTEAAIDVTCFETATGQTQVPIGKPINNTRILILDKDLQLVPIGVKGEIFISGEALAIGYVNNQTLTDEKFVQVFNGHTWVRAYRTGDIGWWRQDGCVMFDGRADHQVKVRGYRIELAEIEQALRTCPGVTDAVVMTIPDTDGVHTLVACYTAADILTTESLYTFLAALLPEYMIPSRFQQVETFPLNTSGKIDRQALADIGWSNLTPLHTFVAPRNEPELALSAIWQQVMGQEQISVDANFFDLGGHSLKAARIIGRIKTQLCPHVSLHDLFQHPTIALLAKRMTTEWPELTYGNMAAPAGVEIPRPASLGTVPVAPAAAWYPVSHAQKRLWILQQLDLQQAAYNMTGRYLIKGDLSISVLHDCFLKMIQRHEILRTTFKATENYPIQIVKDWTEMAGWWSFADHIGLRDSEAVTIETAEAATTAVFDLENGPLIRVAVWRVGEQRHIMQLSMHHIISDGWSMDIMVEEISRFYKAALAGVTAKMPALRIQYKDYAIWQAALLEQGVLNSQREYWHQRLSGEVPVLKLPADRPRSGVKTFRGDMLTFVMDAALAGSLNTYARSRNATLFMLLVSAVKVLLHRYTEQNDIIIGTPIAGRLNADLENQLGFYVNTLVLRTHIDEGATFNEILQLVKQTALEAYAHQAYPFDLLVEELSIKRDVSRNPLFDVMVNMQGRKISTVKEESIYEVEISSMERAHYTSMFDIWIGFEEVQDEILLSIEYNTDLFEQDRISRLGNHLINLCKQLPENGEETVQQLNYIGHAERNTVLHSFNDTRIPYREEATVMQLFESAVVNNPLHTALVFGATRMTFRELDEQASRLGNLLRSQYGINRNMPVVVMVNRSEWLVICLLGVLKAGGTYVPVLPDMASGRALRMMKDCKASLVITENECNCHIGELSVPLLTLGALQTSLMQYPVVSPEYTCQPTDLMYIMYTSGSTGEPKGCRLTHRGIVNRIEWMWNAYGFRHTDVVLQKTTFVFDVSVWEIFMPLCFGAKMVVCSSEEVYSPSKLTALIEREKVTAVHFVPAMLAVFLEELQLADIERIASLRHTFASGEALPVATVENYYRKIKAPLHNLYGPTEASVDVTAGVTKPGQDSISIGKPIANTEIYILDRNMSPLPIGIPGELYIGGVGLAKGYCNEQLTNQSFVAHPFKAGERVYKTGDIASWTAEGTLHFVGRADEQIKIRGIRIEPGEIEKALLDEPLISVCKVTSVSLPDGSRELAAYFVSDEHQVKLELDGKSFLSEVEHTAEWAAVFDSYYSGGNTLLDETFNINGWNSSYTGLPFTTAEMREWVDRIVARVCSQAPRNLLEIGCGTGLLLYRIAPSCTTYMGTDISMKALEGIREYMAREPAKWGHVRLALLAANEIGTLQSEFPFDTILLNSVVQYFPSAQYLLEVLQQCRTLLSPRGRIILGDVRSMSQLELFHFSVQLSRAAGDQTVEALLEAVARAVREEKELVISPAFFTGLEGLLNDLAYVEVLPRTGGLDNELNNFRYDVVLHFGERPAATISPEGDLKDMRGQHTDRFLDAMAFIEKQKPLLVAEIIAYMEDRPPLQDTPSSWERSLRENTASGQELVNMPMREKLYKRNIIPHIKSRLQQVLPEYMIPAYFIRMNNLPLTANGKIDIKQLPSPLGKIQPERQQEPPGTEVEHQLADIWKDILGVYHPGINDNFFDLGGQSLKAIQVVARVKSRLHVSIQLADLFSFPTIRTLAVRVEELLAAAIVVDEGWPHHEEPGNSILI